MYIRPLFNKPNKRIMRRNPWQMGAMLLAFMLTTTTLMAQTISERQKISNSYDQAKLTQLSQTFKAQAEQKKEEAVRMASQNGWELERVNSDGSIDELVSVEMDILSITPSIMWLQQSLLELTT